MKKMLVLLSFCVWGGFALTVVSAQDEHGKEAQAEHKQDEESPLQAASRWVNFVVLFGGLGYLLRKPMRSFFQTRLTEIGSGLERAQEARTSARARMDEIEQRLARLSQDVAALRAEAEKESTVDRDKIFAEAKREVERVIEQSRQEIERVARSVEREIRGNIADLVVDRASNTLRSEMTQDDQKRVVIRFIKKL